MLDQGLHDLAQARIGNILPALERDVGQVVFGYVGMVISWNQLIVVVVA
jgi:hypothetical protein